MKSLKASPYLQWIQSGLVRLQQQWKHKARMVLQDKWIEYTKDCLFCVHDEIAVLDIKE